MAGILNHIVRKKNHYAVGLLSGTSVDGIDAALVKINGYGDNTKLKLIDFITVKTPVSIKNEVLKNSYLKTANIEEICRLNVILGKLFSNAVKRLQKRNMGVKIDFIGSHGQTIHHLPEKVLYAGYRVKSTFQIGDPSVIANLTGITTVGDFRIADCAVNGDGAPLVPFLDYILFRSSKLSRGLLNIGGISNLTVLPKSCKKDDVIAFDTGPGNMLVDELMRLMYNKPFDKDGETAKKGKVNQKLFDFLLHDDYYKLKPPKSTGREHYGSHFVKSLLKRFVKLSRADVIRTVTEYTAHTIWYNYEKFISKKVKIDELIVSGGGSDNPVITNSLKKYFKGIKIKKINAYGIDQDSKEAVLFAILANECLAGNPANMKSVTGSKKDVILGKICSVN